MSELARGRSQERPRWVVLVDQGGEEQPFSSEPTRGCIASRIAKRMRLKKMPARAVRMNPPDLDIVDGGVDP